MLIRRNIHYLGLVKNKIQRQINNSNLNIEGIFGQSIIPVPVAGAIIGKKKTTFQICNY